MAEKVDYKKHWDKTYSGADIRKLGWYEALAEPSLRLIKKSGIGKTAKILHVGAGASTLVDLMLEQGFTRLFVNDISEIALDRLRLRLGPVIAEKVSWIVDDIVHPTTLLKIDGVDLWHDRAVLHFFNLEKERASYFQLVNKLVKPGGQVIIATFSLEGASRCSGLPVFRYDEEMLHSALGDQFRLVEAFDHTYEMPSEDTRKYIYTLFRRI